MSNGNVYVKIKLYYWKDTKTPLSFSEKNKSLNGIFDDWEQNPVKVRLHVFDTPDLYKIYII